MIQTTNQEQFNRNESSLINDNNIHKTFSKLLPVNNENGMIEIIEKLDEVFSEMFISVFFVFILNLL